MPDLDQLRELTGQFRPPPLDDLIAVSRSRRRRAAMGAGAMATAAVIVAIAAATGVADRRAAEPPIGPSPSPTVTTTAVDPAVDVQIQGWGDYLASTGAACDGCNPVAFDQDSGTLLAGRVTNGDFATLRVFGPDGRLAALDCPAVACGDGWREMDLGPDPDEVSILKVDSAAAEVYVVAFDGTVRRTIDLSAVGDFYDFQRLAWSPDGTRLALTTSDAKIWLVDSDGRSPQLVYGPSRREGPTSSGKYLSTVIWGTTWSPDGSRLGFIEVRLSEPVDPKTPFLFRAISVLLPESGQDGPGDATTLYDHSAVVVSSGSSGLSGFLWSPDGTRVAVTVDNDRMLELSADDGSVLARHPATKSSYLVWPARQR